MENIKNLVKEHIRKYPKSQIQDIIKLLYQMTFGNDFLGDDENQSVQTLRDEYKSIGSAVNRNNEISYEDIGGRYTRIYLNDYINTIPGRRITARISMSSTEKKSDKTEFTAMLDYLKDLCLKDIFSFDKVEATAFIDKYKLEKSPVIEHSNDYVQSYNAHYVVVRKKYIQFFEVFYNIEKITALNDNIIIAIEGKSGSRKRELANLIGKIYDCNIFHMDDFSITPIQKTKKRMNEIGGNVDYLRFKNEVLYNLIQMQDFTYRKYDSENGKFVISEQITLKSVNIVEGTYSFHHYFGDVYNLLILLDTDDETQKTRLTEEYNENRYSEEYLTYENIYLNDSNLRKPDIKINT